MSTRAKVEPDKGYLYPISLGTPEWYALSPDERLQVCQIPEDVIHSLPSYLLAISCIENPLALQFCLRNDEHKAISEEIQTLNCLSQILNRRDGIENLVELYQSLSANSEYKYALMKLEFLELLLSRDEVLSKASGRDLMLIEKAAREKMEYKINNPEMFGLGSAKKALMLEVSSLLKQNILFGVDKEICEDYQENYVLFSVEDFERVYQITCRQREN